MQVNRSGISAPALATEQNKQAASATRYLQGPLNGLHHGAAGIKGSVAPDNLRQGLLGMGQVALLKGDNQQMETGGCGPCIGVGITYRSRDGETSGLLAHLQPEADIKDFAANVRQAFDDHFESEINLTLATVLDKDPAVADQQQTRLAALQQNLRSQYDYLDLDDDNVHVSTAHSALSVDLAANEIKTSQETKKDFSTADMDYMRDHMLNDSRTLRYFTEPSGQH